MAILVLRAPFLAVDKTMFAQTGAEDGYKRFGLDGAALLDGICQTGPGVGVGLVTVGDVGRVVLGVGPETGFV